MKLKLYIDRVACYRTKIEALEEANSGCIIVFKNPHEYPGVEFYPTTSHLQYVEDSCFRVSTQRAIRDILNYLDLEYKWTSGTKETANLHKTSKQETAEIVPINKTKQPKGVKQ